MLRSVPVKLRALKMKQTESSILILDFISVLQVKMKSYTLRKKERGNVWTWLKYTKVVHPRFLHVTLLSSHRGKKDRFVKKPKNILHHYLFHNHQFIRENGAVELKKKFWACERKPWYLINSSFNASFSVNPSSCHFITKTTLIFLLSFEQGCGFHLDFSFHFLFLCDN